MSSSNGRGYRRSSNDQSSNRNRSRSRRQRGGGNNDNNNNNNKSTNNKKKKKGSGIKDSDLMFMIGEQQAKKFNRLIKYLAKQAQKECGTAISYIIEQEQEFPFSFPVKGKPTLKVGNNNATREDVDVEVAMLEVVHKTKVKCHTDPLDTYRTNKELLCGVITEKITKGVQEQLKLESDCAIKKQTDPVWLLQRLRHYCTSYKGNQYLPAIYLNALNGVATIKQGEHESVTNFTERVKTRVTTYWNTISPTGEPIYHALAAKYAKACTGMQAPEDDEEKARQALLSYIIIKKSNDK